MIFATPLIPCTWQAPFRLPVYACEMCAQKVQINALGDVAGLSVCLPCRADFARAEGEHERRIEEAAEAYHNGYAVVMW